jgi:hypothetical protein
MELRDKLDYATRLGAGRRQSDERTKERRYEKSSCVYNFDVEAVHIESFPILACDLIGDKAMPATSSYFTESFSSFACEALW